MKRRDLIRIALGSAILGLTAVQSASSDDWTPWKTVGSTSISYRTKRGTFDYGNGNREYVWQVRNDYNAKVSFSVKVIGEKDGKDQNASAFETLASSAVSSTGGATIICSRIKSFEVSGIKPAN